jgi:hypothetical protein
MLQGRHEPDPTTGHRTVPLRLIVAPALVVLVVVGFGQAGRASAGMLTAAVAAPPTLDWTRSQPTRSPPPLAYSASAYDADDSTLVLFGGVTAGGTLSDVTWVWDGRAWTGYPPSTGAAAPPARELASMAFDPALHKLILFGGQGAGGTLLDDTWAWNGVAWVEQPGGPGPSAREAAAMAYSPDGNLVLFGGTGTPPATTPAPAPTTTTTVPVTGAGPPADLPTSVHAALGDTWEWTSRGWSRSSPGTAPPARSGAALAFDAATGTDVLFSGEAGPTDSAEPQLLGDTWSWNGSRWTEVKPANRPTPRFGAVFGYMPAVAGPVLVSGSTASGVTADAWLWSAGSWTQAHVSGGANPRDGASGGFDAGTGALVVFGGNGGGGATLGDTGLITVVPAPTAATTTTTTLTPGPPTASKGTVSPSGKRPANPPPAKARHPGSTTTVAGRRGPAAGRPLVSAPAATPVLSLEASAGSARRGAAIRLSGSGFAPGSQVTIPTLVGRVTADAAGRFSVTVEVPSDAALGTHRFVAAGTSATGGPATLAATVRVLAGPSGRSTSAATDGLLIGLAVLVPVATWLAMAGAGRWRSSRRTAG